MQGRIQDFQLGGAHLKKMRRAEGGAKNFGVFRVKNHDFTHKNHIFSNFRGGGGGGGGRPVRPPSGSATGMYICVKKMYSLQIWYLNKCDCYNLWWFSLSPPISITDKTDRKDITEILLKVPLKYHHGTKQTPIYDSSKNVLVTIYDI